MQELVVRRVDQLRKILNKQLRLLKKEGDPDGRLYE